MKIALWVVQIVMAVLFAASGAFKMIVPRDKLAQKARWAETWPSWRIKLLGLADLAGAVGLVVPAATGIAPVLTPVAALCLAVLMAGAVETHRRLREGFAQALVLCVLCLGIAAGRLLSS